LAYGLRLSLWRTLSAAEMVDSLSFEELAAEFETDARLDADFWF
jgi:hypothetical protein